MTKFTQPLSILFIWHPCDEQIVKPQFDHCYSLMSRDVKKPFSRSMNLPLFYCINSSNIQKSLSFQSEKIIVFIFLSKEIVADEKWINSLKDIPNSEHIITIPIAIDEYAFGLGEVFGSKNYIRAFEYFNEHLQEKLFIAIAHEIYRYSLNESFSKIALGNENALKVFLSHTKDGKYGIDLAVTLKKYIDNTVMTNFFDATDIAPNYRFDDEIIGHIKGSTIVSIHTDSYSSRYWCQREILSAKEYNRPIIAVDCLEEFEDRRFPFASNIPGIHIHLEEGRLSEKDILKILSSALLETIRFFYSKLLLGHYKTIGWINEGVEILSRPPEVADLEKLIFSNGTTIDYKYKQIVYPEPPVYTEELNFLSTLGIQISTPLNIDVGYVKEKKVGVSISDLSSEELIELGQTKNHLLQLSQELARHMLSRGATLNYGGDLRKDGFTEFIFNEAMALQTRTNSQNININNFIAWPIYKADTKEIVEWKAKYRTVAKMVESLPPLDVKDMISDVDIFLPPSNVENQYVWSRSLTKMRETMVKSSDLRIFAGGKHEQYKGIMPGVLQEIILTLESKRPIFLLGGFGGVTASVCRIIQSQCVPDKLTHDWQIRNNQGYKELLEYSLSKDSRYSINYDSLLEKFNNVDFRNGLTTEENERLFMTPYIEEALYLVLKGIKKLSK